MNNQKTWIATFNGATAHVYSATEEGRLTQVPHEDSAGTHKDATDPTTEPNHENEDAFVAAFAQRLDELARQGKFDRLIVAAGPHALGAFRKAASAQLKSKELIELSKDYTNTPVKALEAQVAEYFA